MTERKRRIFVGKHVNNDEELVIHEEKPTLQYRATAIDKLRQLDKDMEPQMKPLPHQRRSMFDSQKIRQRPQSVDQKTPKRYSYNVQNHISREGQLFNCNLFDCKIIDQESESELFQSDNPGNIKNKAGVPFHESQLIYHAQYIPNAEQNQQQKQPVVQANNIDAKLQQSPAEISKSKANTKRAHIFKKNIEEHENKEKQVSLKSVRNPLIKFNYVNPENKPNDVYETGNGRRAVSLQPAPSQTVSSTYKAVACLFAQPSKMPIISEQSQHSMSKVKQQVEKSNSGFSKQFVHE